MRFTEYLNMEENEQTCYADLEREITDSVTAEIDDDDEPPWAPALGEVIQSLNVVRSFVECNGGDSEMLRLVSPLENMTFGAANYRTRQSHIDDYFGRCSLVLTRSSGFDNSF
ncbi:unnamed protein product [Ixodes pacificus]